MEGWEPPVDLAPDTPALKGMAQDTTSRCGRVGGPVVRGRTACRALGCYCCIRHRAPGHRLPDREDDRFAEVRRDRYSRVYSRGAEVHSAPASYWTRVARCGGCFRRISRSEQRTPDLLWGFAHG